MASPSINLTINGCPISGKNEKPKISFTSNAQKKLSNRVGSRICVCIQSSSSRRCGQNVPIANCNLLQPGPLNRCMADICAMTRQIVCVTRQSAKWHLMDQHIILIAHNNNKPLSRTSRTDKFSHGSLRSRCREKSGRLSIPPRSSTCILRNHG